LAMAELEVAVRSRQMGKTTDLLAWMRRAPEGEHRVLVSHSREEATRLYRSTFSGNDNPTDLESWQFVGINEVLPGAWSGVLRGRGGRVVLGIDNLDLVLPMLVGLPWPIGALTMTGTPL
jgi:hypothetical protein